MNGKILFYILGAVSGAAATYFIMKDRMEQQIQDEVEAFKKDYSDTHDKNDDQSDVSLGVSFIPDPVPDEEKENRAKRLAELNLQKKQDLMKVRDISERMNYNAFSKPPREEDVDTGDDDDDEEVEGHEYPREGLADETYTIDPDRFINECPFFDKVTLEYYEDGVLADALTEEPLEDIDGAIGFKSLEKFGEFEEDVVYVRNEKRSTDYEVILQRRPFMTLPGEE